MSDPITWTFKLLDKVSGPAGAARRGVGDFIQTLHSGMAVVGMLGDVAARTGQVLSDALEPARFKESTTVGLGVLLRDSEKAARLYQEAVKFAAATPFETRQVVDSYQKLLVAGFKETEIPIVLKGIGDLGAIKGFSQEVIDRITVAFGQIKAKGKLSGEELMQLAESGVPLGRVYETLGKIFGKTTDQIRKMQEAGQIGADEGIFAVMKVLRDDIGGGKLGNVMEQISRTLDGIVSTLKSRPFEYLQELTETPGYAKVRDALGAISDALDTTTPKGKELLDVVKEFGGGLLERLFGVIDTGSTEAAIDAIIDSVKMLEASTFGLIDGLKQGLGTLGEFSGADADLKETRATFEALGTSIGAVVQVLGKAASALQTFFGWFYDFGDWVSEHKWIQSILFGGAVFNPMAALATGSLAQGFRQSTIGAVFGDASAGGSQFGDYEDWLAAYNAVNLSTGGRSSTYYEALQYKQRRDAAGAAGLGDETGRSIGDGYVDGLDTGVRDSLGIHSPSRVAMDIGRKVGGHAGDGLAAGLEQGLTGGGATAFAPVINITVPAGTSRSLADEIAAAVSRALAAQWEMYSLQLGRAV